MAINVPPLVVPPRPPELPAVAPPKGQGEPFLRNDAHLSNWIDELERVLMDAWRTLKSLLEGIDQRITRLETRVADTYTWGQKGTLTIEEAEEGEEAEVTLLALPLRIVRAEEILECTAATEVPGRGGTLLVQHQASGPDVPDEILPPARHRLPRPPSPPRRAPREEVSWTTVTTLTLSEGSPFVAVAVSPPFKLKKDDALRVVIAEVGEVDEDDEEAEGLGDVVVQARCR